MTLYGIDSKERRTVAVLIGMAAVGFAFSQDWLLGFLDRSVPWWIDAPSVMGFYGLLYLLFDAHIWRFAAKLGLVSVPNLNGLWSGTLISSHDGHRSEHGVYVTIKQTWSRMSIILEAEKSRSHSVVIGLATENQTLPRLVYNYVRRCPELS